MESPLGDRSPHEADGAWDQVSTIFTFTIAADDSDWRPLGYEECWEIYTSLSRDLTERLAPGAPETDRALPSLACHTGQPVRIRQENGTCGGALRVASGARLVSRVAFDPTLGADVDARLAAQVDGVQAALDKIALIRRLRAEPRPSNADGDGQVCPRVCASGDQNPGTAVA